MSADIVNIFLVAAVLWGIQSATRKKQETNPPGPKPLPLIGNVLNFPVNRQWVTFAEWKKQYGNVIYLNVLGTPMVILNSLDVCINMLDKRSNKYSGRPRSVIPGEYMGFDYSFPIMDYAPRWRRYRKLFHQHFNEHVSLSYRPVQERGVNHFLLRLLEEPEEFLRHTRLLFGQTILDIIYDIKVDDSKSIYIQAAENAIKAALEVTLPGRFLVEFFPAMKYLPPWFPGGTFKKFAAERKPAVLAAKDLPAAHVKNSMEAGTAGPSVLSSMLELSGEMASKADDGIEESPEEVAKGCAALAYLGGADTTLSTLQAFFMAIANNQHVQRAAWAEIDALLGSSPSRLPSFEDKDQLPFVVAITKEILRWHNVVPLGLPHALTEDDEYDGYTIRKGTVIMPNIWAILHDPEVYPEPSTFNPWRWLVNTSEGLKLNPDVPEPTAAFGFGRRFCPGRHFATNSLFIIIAKVLACFEVRPLDDEGKPADHVNEAFTSGFLIYPVPFKVSIIPRSSHLKLLVRDLAVAT